MFTVELPQTIWASVSNPPPFWAMPKFTRFFLAGASLMPQRNPFTAVKSLMWGHIKNSELIQPSTKVTKFANTLEPQQNLQLDKRCIFHAPTWCCTLSFVQFWEFRSQNSSSIFTFCPSSVHKPDILTSYFLSTVWPFRQQKPNIFWILKTPTINWLTNHSPITPFD